MSAPFRVANAVGLVLLMILPASALATPIAGAASIHLEEVSEAAIFGEQIEGKHVLSIEGSSLECTTAVFTSPGTVKNGATTVTVHPEYSGCSAFGFLEATVTTTGCSYEQSAGEELSEEMEWSGATKLVCGSGKTILIKAGTCQATISAQTFGGFPEIWTNTTLSRMDMDFNFIDSLVVNKIVDGLLCPFSGTGTVTGTYTGKTTFKAISGGVDRNVTWKR